MPKPCIPDHLPLTGLKWKDILPLVGQANRSLARYDGMLQTLPNPAVLLSPITANEAVLSSKIEGTQATLDEVLEAEAGLVNPDTRHGDIEEISNYRAAVSIAESMLVDQPITLTMIRQVHQRLLQGVRGRNKLPGKIREDQNWIGRKGDPIEKARFIPPSPLMLQDALEEWRRYIGLETEDPLLQTAVAHAQFEILHPFKDGNGRVGRMLIPLILHQRGALSRPMFYMSEYLEGHRNDYYDRLLGITQIGDWHGWISFFLKGLVEQADANLAKVRSVRDLYDETKRAVAELTRSQFAMAAVDVLFSRPVISGPVFAREAAFNNRVTANAMLRQLEIAGQIKKIREGSGPVPTIYAFTRLINIAEGKPVFQETEPRLL